MRDFPPELIYVLIIGAVLLFNLVMQKAARQRQEQAAKNAPVEQEIPEEQWSAAPVTAAVKPEPEEVLVHRRRIAAPAAPPPRTQAGKRLRVARQALFGDRWDVQEAVVVATILGRCRADEPHDVR